MQKKTQNPQKRIFFYSITKNPKSPQNDHLNLCFVKYGHIVAKKMAGNVRTTAIYHSLSFPNSLYVCIRYLLIFKYLVS